MGGHNVDAFVAIGGCDKNMPGSMIAIKPHGIFQRFLPTVVQTCTG